MLFLKEIVWPLIAKDCLQHNRGFSPWGGQPFPPHPPSDCSYVGEVYRGAARLDSPQGAFEETLEIRRNSPCPCGSGRKFKICCGSFFWQADGTPISPQQFSDKLFRKILG